ncbi:MAG: 50S ribosomal protein L29 [Planctomycetota bacterium]|jgi:large subunit ribosomal protein L29
MQTSELKQMPIPELRERVKQLREEVFTLRFKAVTEPVTDPAGLRKKRKEIARILTVITQQQQGDAPRKRISRETRKARAIGAENVAELKRRKAARATAGRRVSQKAKAKG